MKVYIDASSTDGAPAARKTPKERATSTTTTTTTTAKAMSTGRRRYHGTGAGVRVKGIELGSAEGRMVFEPNHPLADAEGYVRYPDIDMSSQMTQLIMAQRGYQANAAIVDRAKATYEAALQIGRS